MIFSINTGKHVTKSNFLCVIKPINRTREKRKLVNLIKGMSEKSAADLIPNVKSPKASFQIKKQDKGVLSPHFYFTLYCKF